MIIFNNWQISSTGVLAQQYDNLTRKVEIVGELPEGYEWSLLVECGENKDTLHLERTSAGAEVVLTQDNLSVSGYYKLQLRGNLAEDTSKTRHTNPVQTYVPASLTGTGEWPEMPSEFAQIEQNILAAAAETGEAATRAENAGKVVASSKEAAARSAEAAAAAAKIAKDSATDAAASESGAKTAEQGAKDAQQGAQASEASAKACSERVQAVAGNIPYIGANGNWFIGNQDTGVPGKGDPGRSIYYGTNVLGRSIGHHYTVSPDYFDANGNELFIGDMLISTFDQGGTWLYRVTQITNGSAGATCLTRLDGPAIYYYAGNVPEVPAGAAPGLLIANLRLGGKELQEGDLIIAEDGQLLRATQGTDPNGKYRYGEVLCSLKGDPGNVLTSPDGTRYQLTVDNSGNLTTTKLS